MQRSLAMVFLVLVSGALHAQSSAPPVTTPDGKFTIEAEIERLPVTSQDRTGTCWSFATVSFLESELERIHQKPIDLSEMFPVYNTYVEKADRFVRLQGKAQFSEGGLCHDVLWAVRRHGIVPAEAYDGLCAGDSGHDHGELAGLLEAMVKRLGDSKKPGPRWHDAIRGVLNAYLGAPPEGVVVDELTISPRAYADQVLRIPYDDYLEVMSFSYTPFWERGELLVPDNWMRYQGYLNVPVEAMMASFDHALRTGYSVAVDMDVSEKGFKMGQGIARLSKELEEPGAITQDLREAQFTERETTDDHLMHVVGIARDKDGETYYLTKNSWGEIGPYRGYLLMSRNFVALKMLSFMVHKDGLAADLLEKF